ncbi:uncharacterized protein LOC141680548 [Apium graveolens]|uniref:uncharacterized protein LOC141680548 n=1 Tax=Apium graveolens TaxID=4045 RepID=UPI003D7A5865
MGCRVGDGRSISIVNDPWLPSSDNPHVETSSEAIQNQTVSSLMLSGVRRWDEDLETKPGANFYDNPCFWKRLWNLHTPPKVKKKLWRSITGCLPTKDMLHLKKAAGMPCDDEYVYNSFQEWAFSTFNGWDVSKRERGAMLCWTIWKCRNDLIWNQRCLEAQEAANSARVALNQWKEAQDRSFDRLFVSSNRYSFEFAARNHKGELLEARSKCNGGTISPDFAEAMGIREALSWIKATQLENVVVEADFLVAVQVIRSEVAMDSYFGTLIQECRDLLKSMRGKGVILKFIKRSTNNLAHALARCSYSEADRIWKVDEVYPEIMHVLENDLI